MKKNDEEKATIFDAVYKSEEAPKVSGEGCIEDWCAKNKTEEWIHKATKVKHGWADGAVISEKYYLAACHECAHGKL